MDNRIVPLGARLLPRAYCQSVAMCPRHFHLSRLPLGLPSSSKYSSRLPPRGEVQSLDDRSQSDHTLDFGGPVRVEETRTTFSDPHWLISFLQQFQRTKISLVRWMHPHGQQSHDVQRQLQEAQRQRYVTPTISIPVPRSWAGAAVSSTSHQ